MNKLDEALEQRTAVRAHVVNLRRELAITEASIKELTAGLTEQRASLKRQEKLLVEINTTATKLMHADLSGFAIGHEDVQADPTGAPV